MTAVEPAAFVRELQESPDVGDVGVGEGVVVVAPVHPLAETLRPADEFLRRPGDLLPAFTRELGEPVLLDLVLGVEAEFPLDAHFNPKALAIEAVLVALVEPAERLVALEDVLQRAAPGRMHAERLVGGHRAVHEAPDRAATVSLTQPIEDAALVPPREDLLLERGMVGNGWKWPEHGEKSV